MFLKIFVDIVSILYSIQSPVLEATAIKVLSSGGHDTKDIQSRRKRLLVLFILRYLSFNLFGKELWGM